MFRLASPHARSTLLASAAIFVLPLSAEAQSQRQSLPPVTVTAPEQKRAASARPPRSAPRPASTVRQARAPAPPAATDQGQGVRGALAVMTAQQALTEINHTPGGVAIVPAAAYKNSTVANTIKDILDYVPGVFAQPKWGDDTRLSIRGSGLSRNFHLRGIQLYMDGIPINTADGYGDFQEIDPTAYKYVEVYKGANALQFGANSLGGAINFVMPTGRDPFPNGASVDFGAFGFKRLQANAGGANGPWDGFVTAATQASDGFRDHSFGSATRVSGNVGYQFSPDAETRFYFNANEVRQRIPGAVTKQSALTNPEAAASRQCRQRPAAQHRHRADRQQDHDPVRRHQGRIRRLRRRPPSDASDLPVARLQLQGLWRLRQSHRRPLHRRLPQPPRRRHQHPQRQHRQPAIRQSRRTEGRAAVVLDRPLEKHLPLCRGQLLLPAECRGDCRHAIPLRHPQPAGSLPQRRRRVGRDRVQDMVAESRPALERRSDLAGLRQHLA